MNGAQLVTALDEVVFTSPDDSLLVTLADLTVVEIFGDGTTQRRNTDESVGGILVGSLV